MGATIRLVGARNDEDLMSLLRAALLSLLSILTCESWAASLQPVPLATPQTTCRYCFFPQSIAVVVTDDAGQPVIGAPVTFAVPATASASIPRVAAPYTVASDYMGVAALPAPGLVASATGAFTVVATSPAASGDARFDLVVAGAGPVEIARITYDNAVGMVGSLYRDRFGVVALDASRNPIAHAAIEFIAPQDGPSVTFYNAIPERAYDYERASEAGFAYAPTMRANSTIGFGEIMARSLDPSVPPFYFKIANSATGVAAIEPFAPTATQVTRVASFFPEFVGAVVRDAAGNSVKDAAVLFDTPYSIEANGAFLDEDAFARRPIVFTGSDGVAMAPLRIVASTASRIPVNATTPGTEQRAEFDLTAIPGPARSLHLVSGAVQRAVISSEFPDRWVLRAVGEDGLAVPYAAIYAYVYTVAGTSGSFGGRDHVVVMADREGIATLPAFTANGVEGSSFVWALTNGDRTAQGGDINLWFENLPRPVPPSYNVRAFFGPNSVGIGDTSYFRFDALLMDAAGNYPNGVPYAFRADPSCARFADGESASGVTVNGAAVSPPLVGVAMSASCLVTFEAEGVMSAEQMAVRVFRPEDVVLTPGQPPIEVVAGSRYVLLVNATVDGLPVNVMLGSSISTSPSGATAAIEQLSLDGGNSGFYSARLLANDRPGTYEVTATYRQARASTIVKQKPR
jgi:hypothetical protein